MRELLISDAVVEAALDEWFGVCTNWRKGDAEVYKWNMRAALTAAILADRAETIEAVCGYLESIHHTNTAELVRKQFSASSIRSMGAYKPGKARDGE